MSSAWLRRSVGLSASFVGLALLGACSTSVEDQVFGGANADAATSSGEASVPYPTNVPGADAGAGLTTDADVVATATCTAPNATVSRICVQLTRGAEGPAIPTTDPAGLAIDGNGALIVGLAETATATDTEASFSVWQALPSAASGATFSISADLPKTLTIDAAPGVYYLSALFRDAQPYDRADDRVGDYLPSPRLTSITLVAGQGYSIDISLLPVRGVDVEVSLAPTAVPAGAAAGPLAVRMTTSDHLVAATAGQDCVDLRNDGPSTMRLLTTSADTSFGVHAALFDFATSLKDPSIVAWLADGTAALAPPPGSIDDGTAGSGLTATIESDSWLGKLLSVPLTTVIEPIVGTGGAPPSDPSPACHAVSALRAPVAGEPSIAAVRGTLEEGR